jgi:hypothetical protein
MTQNVAVRPAELMKGLLNSRASLEGHESASAVEQDPERAAFREALAECQAVLATSPERDNVFGSVDDRMVSLMQSYLAGEGTKHGAELEPSGDGFEAKFDSLDPGWIWSLHDWVKKLDTHPFQAAEQTPVDVAKDFRIAVLSDWGTGAYGAPACAHSIEADKERIDLVLHLGDVYYAGDIDETKDRFLAHWPKRSGALHRALNGNHEMYTGGKGYFKLVLPSFQQRASYFALRNEHWLIVGLDTAYEEHDIYGEQTRWLTDLAAENSGHRIMLFTHHQPFSYFETSGPKLVKKLSPLLAAGRIVAWYWGHEHSCTRYDLHEQWKMYGRCVGHSGFPYFRRFKDLLSSKTDWRRFEKKGYIPGCLQLDGPNKYVTPSTAYGPNGYVTVELRGPRVEETFLDPEGQVLARFAF